MTEKELIEPDRALVDINDDALGVADLAKRLATSILKMTPKDGLVIGLYGAWGTGKTTFINFIRQVITNSASKEQPIILQFNPWLSSGHEDLIQRYLIELSKSLSPTRNFLKKWRIKFLSGTEQLFTISEHLLVFAASLQGNPVIAGGVKAVKKLSNRAIRQLSKQEPLTAQKNKIENLLRKSERKILVIIDDIDRLETEEILDIFRMVKSVADFPNVIYLLSFDKKLVSTVISEFQKSDGNDYLEKIIQYDIDLPNADSAGILKLFSERVDPTIEREGGKKWNDERWSRLYRDYLRDRLRTPRQVVRLSNALNVAYPALIGEVDPVDFLGIEALRMFSPEIFLEIRRTPHRFTELGQDQFDSDKTDPPYFERVITFVKKEDQEAIKSILCTLFPRAENAFSRIKASHDQIAEWRADARVCSSYHFGRYFSYSISPNAFSDAEIKESIELTKDIEKFEQLISGYSRQISSQGKSRIPEFLERALDLVKVGYADANLKKIITSLIILGDSIIREGDENYGAWIRINTDTRILWIIVNAMERLPQKDIYKILKSAYQNTKSIHIPLMILFYLAREHGKYGDKKQESLRSGEQPYLSLKEINNLEKIMLSKIKEAAKNNTLLDNGNLHSILYRWRDVAGSIDEPKSWVKTVASTDDGLKKLLTRLSGISIISNAQGTREKLHVKASTVGNFLDLDQTYLRAQKILKKGRPEKKEKAAIEAFITSYQNIKNGKSDDWD